MKRSISDILKKAISELLGKSVEEIAMNHSLQYLGFDSLDEIELVMAMEEEFEIEIPDGELEKLGRSITVHEVAEYLRKRTGRE